VNRKLTVNSLVVAVLILAVASAGCGGHGGQGGFVATEVPWPMFHQNLQHTGLSPFSTAKDTGVQKWKFATGQSVFSSPAVGKDGTIYVGSQDFNLYAVNPDGTLKWKFPTGFFASPSSPAVGKDRTIYVGSQDTNLYAVNPDGTLKWKFLAGQVVFSSPAVGKDGTIYVGSDDNNLYAVQ
jgi:outer membrane protein assembly factor BamB